MDETVAEASSSIQQSGASPSSFSQNPASPAAGGSSSCSSNTSNEPSGRFTKKARKCTYAARRRCKTLVSMKETKIRSADDYVCARSRFLDLLQPHTSEERFVNANGDYCCAKFELIQLEGVQSVKQVYDALLCFLVNIEISVSERLGHITVREDYDNVEKSISNFRLLSTQCGIQIETNMVTFSKYFESHELSGGNPCGVITVDCVDDDQLHPYLRTRRIRKDIATAMTLVPHMRKKQCGSGEELVVVMGIEKFYNLHHDPALEIPPHKIQELKSSICWVAAMVKSVIDLLHPE